MKATGGTFRGCPDRDPDRAGLAPPGADITARRSLPLISAGIIAAALAAVLFGSAFVATDVALRAFEPLGVAFWRAAVASLALAPIVIFRAGRGGDSPLPSLTAGRRMVRVVALGVAGGPVFLAGMAIAVDQLGASVTAFVVGL